jgi:enoyl-CoA hydratase
VADVVRYEARGRVALITIDRPEARNAVNGDVAHAMEAAIDRLEADDDAWVGIVTGEGPVFSAGADLKAIAAGKGAELNTERGGFGGIASRARTKPLIAAVNGPALAGGCEIALACDLIVASREAVFGIPEVKRSLVAAAGGLFRLPRTLPRNVALELALTGDPIDAERAYSFGLVNALADSGAAVDGAMALAERICANAPLAVQASRRVMLGSLTAFDDDNWARTAKEFGALFSTEDFLEGPRAFIEKRPPNWKGR